MGPIELSLFASRLDGICEEMGTHLRCAAFSVNIRDRLDYSCAVFDADGKLLAQAADIPVHLGSMAYAMRGVVKRFAWSPGDAAVFNDPYAGGTHLPDVTLLAPVFHDDCLCGFVANRAHHADIGADAPGGMPLSSRLEQEGIIIKPQYLIKGGVLDDSLLESFVADSRSPDDERGDYLAQISANRIGAARLCEVIDGIGERAWFDAQSRLNRYGRQFARAVVAKIPDGEYRFSDVMDDDGFGHADIRICVALRIKGTAITVDFDGTSDQVEGNINCPEAVTVAAVYYVFRCLLPAYAPTCQGIFSLLSIRVPEGCFLRASDGCAVVAGNTETSQRVVDCLLGALAEALPHKAVAASQGTMNNIAMGNAGADTDAWSYYETVGGGMGGGEGFCGHSAVQTHMTNTFNTPAEVLEMKYPLRIRSYRIRRASGGGGRFAGGDGLAREFELLAPTQCTVLTDRRRHAPWGGAGGGDGLPGRNFFNGEEVAGKVSVIAAQGDRLRIETPGGGGWGKVET